MSLRKLRLTIFEGPKSGDNGVLGVALSENLKDELCTHIVAQADDPFQQTMFWGHYFNKDAEAARKDYDKRVDHMVRHGYVVAKEISNDRTQD